MAVMAGVERFANKGMGSNLVTYLTGVVGMSTAAAAKSVVTWTGVSFMLPLLSSILTDSYWDRYSTLAASSLLYVLVSPPAVSCQSLSSATAIFDAGRRSLRDSGSWCVQVLFVVWNLTTLVGLF